MRRLPADAEASPLLGRIMVAVGLHALVLRPAALPLGHLRRRRFRSSRRATGSPPTSPRRSPSRRRPTSGSAASPSARSRSSSCPRTGTRPGRRSRSTPSTRRSPRTPRRSCARRRCSGRPTSSSPPAARWTSEGDAPVATRAGADDRRRRDLSGDDAPHPIAEGGHLEQHPGRRAGPDRRDLQGARRGDPPGLPALDEELGDRGRRPRPRPQRRLRQHRALLRGRQRRARRPCAARRRRCAPGPQHRRRSSRP